MNILFHSHDGKLGDAILHTALVKGLMDNYPQVNIYCITAGATTDFWKKDERIKESWVFDNPSYWQVIKLGFKIRKKKIDYIIGWTPSKSEKVRLFNLLVNPKHGVHICDAELNQHASIKEAMALKMLNCREKETYYDISMQNRTIYHFASPYIYLNLFASYLPRTVSTDDAITIIGKLATEFPNNKIYVTYTKKEEQPIDNIKQKLNFNHSVEFINTEKNLDKLISLCKHANVVITPDTSVTHIASAFNTPVIVLFRKKNNFLQTQWAPISDKKAIIEFFDNDSNKQESIKKIIQSIKNFAVF